MIPAIISPNLLMRMYTPDEDVIGQGLLYYRWIWATFLLQGFSLTCTIVLRSVGQVKLPLYTSVGAFFINVFFNYVFIFGKLGAPRLEIERCRNLEHFLPDFSNLQSLLVIFLHGTRKYNIVCRI